MMGSFPLKTLHRGNFVGPLKLRGKLLVFLTLTHSLATGLGTLVKLLINLYLINQSHGTNSMYLGI